ncbi:cation diffusion facilitator family transporter [Rhodoplanes serenus]|uniref:cation diffusion facilitator family transporter n=1 Tax=Rhodoplanes serenus TaxID=200615 RepID=UPI000DACE906|nr:cation transporter [Rhodoplanes serenus]RAI32108.1 cation transporter [Rhodoplanes serenus]
MCNEQTVLRTSIIATIGIAAIGILFGILSGSFAIAFDGTYSLVDAAMSGLALAVARAIAAYAAETSPESPLHRRFQLGFWHLEPLVLGLNATMLMGVSVYALINAVTSLLAGGHDLAFGIAVVYAVVTFLVCAGMAWWETRINRRLKSDFVALDAKAWMMSGGITAALVLAFGIGWLMTRAGLGAYTPYIDPLVLTLICLVIIPLPFGTAKQALFDIMLMAPNELREQVETIAREAVRRYGMLSFRAYVAKVGRSRQIELHFITPPDWTVTPIREHDRIRDEVAAAIGGEGPDRWLTIVFTADSAWAD